MTMLAQRAVHFMNAIFSHLLSGLQRKWKILLLISLLVLVILLGYRVLLSPYVMPLFELTPLPMEGAQRLLVMAPHCDDETLGPGGVIQAAVRAGIEVRVVIATNGDGYRYATMRDFRRIYPRALDFIRMGMLRQQESLAALRVLGVQPEKVYFLGYPDRGSPALWNGYWSRQKPYRSPFSKENRSPYPLTYNPAAVYSGEDYLADIAAILADYRPDLIIYPHPDDEHPDHWGLNAFTRLAIARLQHADPTYTPLQFTYLIHRPDFPAVKGLKPDAVLVPPAALSWIYPNWYRWDLTPEDVSAKRRAVAQYHTQLTTLRGLMESFVRANELFAPVEDAGLRAVAQGDALRPSSWEDADGAPIPPVQLDPVADFITRDVIPSGDLSAIYAAQDEQGSLLACLQMKNRAVPEMLYVIRIKALSADGIATYQARSGRPASGTAVVQRTVNYACAAIPLAELGNPWAVYLGATVEVSGQVVDKSAWQMIYTGMP